MLIHCDGVLLVYLLIIRICSGGDIFDKILEIGNFNEQDGREIFV